MRLPVTLIISLAFMNAHGEQLETIHVLMDTRFVLMDTLRIRENADGERIYSVSIENVSNETFPAIMILGAIRAQSSVSHLSMGMPFVLYSHSDLVRARRFEPGAVRTLESPRGMVTGFSPSSIVLLGVFTNRRVIRSVLKIISAMEPNAIDFAERKPAIEREVKKALEKR